jgi:hypothetical protein
MVITYLFIISGFVGLLGLGPELFPKYFDHNFYLVVAVGWAFAAATGYDYYIPVAVLCGFFCLMYLVMWVMKYIEKKKVKNETI